jgi:hypothetical protein
MATKPPSDADIFLDDDDEPPKKGGSQPSASAPAPSAGGKVTAPVKKPVAAKPKPAIPPKTSLPSKPATPSKKKKKEEDFDFDAYDYDGIAQALQYRMIKAPKQELEKIAKAMNGLSKPGVSVQERVAYKRMMAEAKANLKKIEQENKDFVKQNNKFQNLRNDAIRKLYAVRQHKEENADGLSRKEIEQLEEMEKKLVLTIGHSDLSKNDHEANAQVGKLLEDVQKQLAKLPEELQEKFEELDERTESIMKAQEQASEYLKESHEKMRAGMARAAMGTLDLFGVGGVARGIGKMYGAGKSVAHGVKSVNRYMQARRIMRQRPGDEDPSIFALDHEVTPKPVSQSVGIPPVEYDPDDPLTWSKEQRKTARKGKKLTSPTENKDHADAEAAAQQAIVKAQKSSKNATKRAKKSEFVGPPAPEVFGPPRPKNEKRIAAAKNRDRHASGAFKSKESSDANSREIAPELPEVAPQQVGTSNPVAAEAAAEERMEDAQKERRKEAGKKNEELADLVDVLTKHSASMERFNNRLLAELRGRSKKSSESKGIGSLVQPLLEEVGGLVTKVGPLMGMLGQAGLVAGAGAAGYYVGSKIYEHYGDQIGKGVDSVSNFATHIMGGQTNDDKIEQILKGTGAGSPNNPREARGKVTPSPDKGKPLPQGITPSSAGAGRGSVNPTGVAPSVSSTEVPPTPSVVPVSVGSAAGAAIPGSTVGGSEKKDGSNGGSISDHMGKIFTKSTGVDVDGVQPQMQDALVRMGQEYYDATGKKLNFNSAYRSMEEQEKLYRTKPPGMAGKPGSSLHNFGLAVDIPSTQANELDKLGLLSKYGFTRPIPNEKWHVQPVGVSVASAKQGVYSADAPVDQGGKRTPEQGSIAARQSAPSVTNANYEPPPGAGVGVGTDSGATTNMTTGGSGSVGGTRVSASSIPTFDNSDGLFLALNTGIV